MTTPTPQTDPPPDAPVRIVVADPLDDDAVARLRSAGEVTCLDAATGPTLEDVIPQAEALLIRTRTRVTRALIERAPRLRVIGRAGVGLDNIDLAAARQAGITVVHTPDAATDAVADLTVGLILAAVRRIVTGDTRIRGGQFADARAMPPATELSGLTLGILGFGRIGQAVAKRCHLGFNMPVCYTDIRHVGWTAVAATPVDLPTLLATADILSLHVPLTRRTRGMIDAATMQKMRPGSILINTARGEIVETGALVAALDHSRPALAALDVTDPEPLPAGHPLLTDERVILSAHAGAQTVRGQRNMNRVVDDVIAVLQGRDPAHPVAEPLG